MATRNTTSRRPRKGSGVKVRGFFRIRLVEQDGRISGDSDWFENTVTNLGKRDYLCTPLAGGAAKSIAFMALGTGTGPAVTDTSLQGEISHSTAASRCRVLVVTSQIASSAIEFQATFASSWTSYVTTTVAIQNIMVINSTTSAGTIFAGSTFQVSTLNTNQDVQALAMGPLAA